MRSAFVDLFLLGEIPARLQSKSPFHVRMERGLFSYAHNFRFSPPIPLPPSPEPPEAPGGIQNIEVAIPKELFKGRASREVEMSCHPSKSSPFRVGMEAIVPRMWGRVEEAFLIRQGGTTVLSPFSSLSLRPQVMSAPVHVILLLAPSRGDPDR